MTQSGRVDYDQVARAQALLLTRRRMSPAALVSAYKTVRTETPNAYTEALVEALISRGHELNGETRLTAWTEAVEVARRGVEQDPRTAKVLIKALNWYQHVLCDVGRRPEALEACREQALAGKRAYDNGVVASPTYGTWDLACRLAEEGEHAEAAALFEAMVHDDERAKPGHDFWDRIAWIAEMEAAGQDASARDALRAMADEDRRQADQHTSPYADVVWEQLLLAAMNREHGREQEAERCDRTAEEVLTMLAADGEPRSWSNNLSSWVILIGLTGRSQDRPAPAAPEPPLFANSGWSPDVRRDYVDRGRDHLQSEVARLVELAEREPSAHLAELVETQRKFTLRSAKYWHHRTWYIPDELRSCFDEGVELARRLVDIDEPLGRAALSRALADRTSIHVAALDFPPALRDFQQARRARSGSPIG